MSAEILVCFALDRMDHVLSTSIVKGIQHRSVRRSGAGPWCSLRSGIAASATGVPLTDGQLTDNDGEAAAVAILRGFEDVAGSRQAAMPTINYIIISIVYQFAVLF